MQFLISINKLIELGDTVVQFGKHFINNRFDALVVKLFEKQYTDDINREVSAEIT